MLDKTKERLIEALEEHEPHTTEFKEITHRLIDLNKVEAELLIIENEKAEKQLPWYSMRRKEIVSELSKMVVVAAILAFERNGILTTKVSNYISRK